jgi:mycofactocin precursor
MAEPTAVLQQDASAEAVEPRLADGAAPEPAQAVLVESDLLVEDVSIDGMCGVY